MSAHQVRIGLDHPQRIESQRGEGCVRGVDREASAPASGMRGRAWRRWADVRGRGRIWQELGWLWEGLRGCR
eukprot:4694965-Pyramimonas_sp.AAC.1